jgi:ribonuclease HI
MRRLHIGGDIAYHAGVEPSTKFILNTDGAAKGNPGPAGVGVALYREGETEPIVTLGEYIGETTNNVAEYRALIRGLSEALLRGAERIEARTDSELMARQLAGRYKVSAPQIVPLYKEARGLLERFASARVVHVPRAQNALADKLANQGIAAARGEKEKPAKGKKKAAEASDPDEPNFNHTYSTTVNGEKQVYNVERLWELAKDLPVRSIPLSQVESMLDENCWFGDKPPTCRQVANHAKRIYEADFSRPLILRASGEVMDGGHRIARAWLEGRQTIDAVQFETDPEPDYRRTV